MKTYLIISGTLFALVAFLHLLRLSLSTPVLIGGRSLPQWLSVVGLAFAAALSLWAFWLLGGLP